MWASWCRRNKCTVEFNWWNNSPAQKVINHQVSFWLTVSTDSRTQFHCLFLSHKDTFNACTCKIIMNTIPFINISEGCYNNGDKMMFSDIMDSFPLFVVWCYIDNCYISYYRFKQIVMLSNLYPKWIVVYNITNYNDSDSLCWGIKCLLCQLMDKKSMCPDVVSLNCPTK